MPKHKISKNYYLWKYPFGSSADHDVANKPYCVIYSYDSYEQRNLVL